MSKKIKKPNFTIDKEIPSSLKFGVIVAIATFWAQLIRSILDWILSLLGISPPILSDFLVAVTASIVAYFILVSYRRLRNKLRKMTD